MNPSKKKEIVIKGITGEGRVLRPSNWAERLAGVVSPYRPQEQKQAHTHAQRDHLTYSPWCMPGVDDGVKCVVLDPVLQMQSPQAWEYVQQFARENGLVVYERSVE